MSRVLSAALALTFTVSLVADEKPAYRVLAADNGRVAIVNAKGEVEWEVANRHEVHDLALLAERQRPASPRPRPPSSR